MASAPAQLGKARKRTTRLIREADRLRVKVDRIDPTAEALRYVYVKRTRCPVCSSPDLLAVKGPKQQGDGSERRRTRCCCCGHRFYIVTED